MPGRCSRMTRGRNGSGALSRAGDAGGWLKGRRLEVRGAAWLRAILMHMLSSGFGPLHPTRRGLGRPDGINEVT